MQYYAKALQIARKFFPEQEQVVHKRASSLFMELIKSELIESRKFQERLFRAKSTNERAEFEKTLEAIECLKKYRCSEQDDLALKELYEQAKKVFLKTRLQQDFTLHFAKKIEEALLERYQPPFLFVTQSYWSQLQSLRWHLQQQYEHLSSAPSAEQVRRFQQQSQQFFLPSCVKPFYKMPLRS